jgi:hypothetical protein
VLRFASSQRIRYTALGLGLSLLAVVFAMEAKLSMYGPEKNPASEVRASKANPAEVPAVVSHGIREVDPVSKQFAFELLVAFSAVLLVKVTFLAQAAASTRVSAASPVYFPSALSFHPPPVSQLS